MPPSLLLERSDLETLQEPLLAPDDLLEVGADIIPLAIKERLDKGFEAYWSELTNRHTFASDDEAKQEKDIALQKEYAFYNRVVGGVRAMHGRNPGAITTLLSDVDDVFGNVKEDDDKGIRVLVRPAFSLAIETLGDEIGDRLEFGLLTSKPQGTLDAELTNPTYLAGIAKKVTVNPRFMISSRGVARQNPYLDKLEDAKTDEEVWPAIFNIVDPELFTSGYDHEFEIWKRYDTKLAIIDRLVADPAPEDENRVYVCLDDRPYVELIDPTNERVMGICVANEQQDVLVRDLQREIAAAALAV